MAQKFVSSSEGLMWIVNDFEASSFVSQNYKMDESIDRCYKLLQEPISIEQCLKDFTKEEELGDDETW